MQLVPGMQERVLRKVIGKSKITRELAQEIPHLGLMASDELAECGRIMLRQSLGDKFIIIDPRCARFFTDCNYSFLVPNWYINRYATPIRPGNAALPNIGPIASGSLTA